MKRIGLLSLAATLWVAACGGDSSNTSGPGATKKSVSLAAPAVSTNEDTAVEFDFTADVSPKGAAVAIVVDAEPAHGKLTVDGLHVTYTPEADYNGADEVKAHAESGSVKSDAVTVAITVKAVNDAPTLTGGTLSTSEDTAGQVTLTGTDKDGDTLTYKILSQGAKGAVTLSGATYTYTPAANANGADTFTAAVSDGKATSAAVVVSVTIAPVADAPAALHTVFSTDEDVPYDGTVSVFNPDPVTLAYAVVTGATKGTFTLDPLDGTFTFTPNLNANGSDTVWFSVDGASVLTKAKVDITITPVNDIPYADASTLATAEDTEYRGTLTGSDPVEGSPVTVEIVAQGAHGTAIVTDATNGYYRFLPADDYNGTDVFSFRVSDGTSYSAPATVFVSISPVTDPATAMYGTLVLDEDSFADATAPTHNPDLQAATYAVVTGATKGTFTLNPVDGSYTYTPTANLNGADVVWFRVTDTNTALQTVGKIDITITPVNDWPTVSNDARSPTEDRAYQRTFAGNDIDGDTLYFSVLTAPAHGSVTWSTNGDWRYKAVADYNGSDSFTFRAFDGTVWSNVGTVTLTVGASNDRPYLASFSINVTGTSFSGTLKGSDVEGSTLTYSVERNPFHGTVSGFNGTTGAYTYTPAVGYEGYDLIGFQASDGSTSLSVVWIKVGTCEDSDGDGYGTGCLRGTDCNDADPTIYPNAPELPGDGVVQACGGADMAVTDTTGIFVSKAGNDANPGTKASPKLTVTAGIAAAQSASKAVFVATGTYAEGVTSSVSIFGGFHATTWAYDATAYPTVLTSAANSGNTLEINAQAAVRGLTIFAPADGIGLYATGVTVTVVGNKLRGNTGGWTAAAYVEGGARAIFVNNDIFGGWATDNDGINNVGDLVALQNTIHAGISPDLNDTNAWTNAIDVNNGEFNLIRFNTIHAGISYQTFGYWNNGTFNYTELYGNDITGGSSTADTYPIWLDSRTLYLVEKNTIDAGQGGGDTYGMFVNSRTSGSVAGNTINAGLAGRPNGTAYGSYFSAARELKYYGNFVTVPANDFGFGLYVSASYHVTAATNVIVVKSDAQTQETRGFYSSSYRVDFYNNTVSAGTTANDKVVRLGTNNGRVNLFNNLFIGGNPAIHVSTTTNGYWTNNDFFGATSLVYDSAVNGSAVPYTLNTLADFTACTWTGCAANAGNISADPGLAAGSFVISKSGACYDTGIDPVTKGVVGVILEDITGLARPQGSAWDIGAYEIP